MHDMSNTRKEIAARLGFAAGNGANKEAKAALDAWRLAVQKEEAYLGSVFVNPMKQREVEARTQAAYELAKRLNPDYQGFSRPGAKVSFDTYTDMVNELRRFTADSANVQYDWYTAANTWLGRKRTSGNKEIAVEANRAYDAVEREMRPKWRQSRPGAKAEFAIDARDELMMRTWIKNNYPKADNAAFNKMLAKMTKEYAKDPKGYTYGGGFRAVAKAAGFSRDGAKAKFADAALNQIRNNSAISDKILTLVSKGLSVPQAIDSVLGEGTYKRIGSEVYDELKKPNVKKASTDFDLAEACWEGYEAVGTKKKDGKTVPNCVPMSRDEREEQKAGLKIMSAANPAVGAKVAKLIKEGKPQDQAVAIALDMQRRGEL